MQGQNEDLWGPATSLSATSPAESLDFEDAFSPPQDTTSGGNTQQQSADGDYVPLDDSSQYLAGLERKLACVQGRTTAHRQTESRRLIDALATSRDDHAHHLLNNTNNIGADSDVLEPDNDRSGALTAATVDPQGALGAMLRRVAPDKIALAPEELCRLLEADILSKVHDALEEEAQAPHPPTQHSKNTSEEDQSCEGVRSVDGSTENNTIKLADQKDPSSDEGEK
ncbi:uncharacterized protein LOC121865255 [Homarus americanus]|uniref:Putative Coiled-coil domain containing 32-containing protein n=1 Tax=Homarus americanus TaxID=6706 RepID=A0A8J5MZI0_HOMAM|nr:uncharacterized protein LOC121865255 [Homarus americanus]KAG7169880.1 putative Coiled-coil domain containing 32-containing protein [Homarus americanus]